jgi:hypothetical protein
LRIQLSSYTTLFVVSEANQRDCLTPQRKTPATSPKRVMRQVLDERISAFFSAIRASSAQSQREARPLHAMP